MLSAAYDILKKDAAELVWLEAAYDCGDREVSREGNSREI
jgi:hypothetical protein